MNPTIEPILVDMDVSVEEYDFETCSDEYEFSGSSAVIVMKGNLPEGGNTGEVLTKVSDEDYDADWKPLPFTEQENGSVNFSSTVSAGTELSPASVINVNDLTTKEYVDTYVDNIVNIVNQTYIYEQPSASAVWTINHNLGKHPSVTVVDSAGTVVVGDVQYTSNDQIICTFTGAFSGMAYLN